MQLLFWQTPTANRVKATIHCKDGHVCLCDVPEDWQDRVVDDLREITDGFDTLPPLMHEMRTALEAKGYWLDPDLNPQMVFYRMPGVGEHVEVPAGKTVWEESTLLGKTLEQLADVAAEYGLDVREMTEGQAVAAILEAQQPKPTQAGSPAPELDNTLAETPVTGTVVPAEEEPPRVWTIDELLSLTDEQVSEIAVLRGIEIEGKTKDDLAIDIVEKQGQAS